MYVKFITILYFSCEAFALLMSLIEGIQPLTCNLLCGQVWMGTLAFWTFLYPRSWHNFHRHLWTFSTSTNPHYWIYNYQMLAFASLLSW